MLKKQLEIKVCGMKLAANVLAIASLQPNYLGFIFYDKSPRFINEVSAELIKYVPAPIKTVGVFVNETIDKVKNLVVLHQLNAVQLHGIESADYCADLKATFAEVEIIKAFGIDESFDFNTLSAYENVVDYFLFDTKTSLPGGSGKTFDWSVLDRYTLDKPYFLSGGIDLEHATDLKNINDPRLVAVDVNSKFEIEPGLKDAEKVHQFITQLRSK